MKKIITYGTFDLIHRGHINLLRRARKLGDHLTVALSTNSFNKLKNKKSYYNYKDRKIILESIKYVDKVIPEKKWEQKINDIKKYNINIFVMGDDWKGKFDYLSKYCKVVYLARTKNISTTKIMKDLNKKELR
jgi:glycerol-3-phosphate cytidylyltransferase